VILFQSKIIINQLEKRKGGYFYLTLPGEVVDTFPGKRKTRLLCTFEKKLTFPCGLNHLGDGNFFIIINRKNISTILKKPGDTVEVKLMEDPNPLGVDMPEVLEALLEQEEELKEVFEKLTMGRKRFIIHAINKIKDIDKQIGKAEKMLRDPSYPSRRKLIH
jgi:hypothetical protein